MRKLHFFLIPIFAVEFLNMFLPFWTKYYSSPYPNAQTLAFNSNGQIHSIERGFEFLPAYIVLITMVGIGLLGLINKNKVTAIIALVFSTLTLFVSIITLGLISISLNLNFWGPKTYKVVGPGAYINVLLSLCLLLVMIFHLVHVIRNKKTVKKPFINEDLLDS